MYWRRIVKLIKERNIESNKLAHSIDVFNDKKCRLNPEWRNWLITHDEYSDIKNEVLNLIRYSSQL
jgi:hypothetical protein